MRHRLLASVQLPIFILFTLPLHLALRGQYEDIFVYMRAFMQWYSMSLWEIFVRVHFYRYLYMLRDKSERIKLFTAGSRRALLRRLISDVNCSIAIYAQNRINLHARRLIKEH